MRNLAFLLTLLFTLPALSQAPNLSLSNAFENKPNGSLISRIAGVDDDANIYSLRREQFTKTDYESWSFDYYCLIDKHSPEGAPLFSKKLDVKLPKGTESRMNDLFMMNGQLYGFASTLIKEGKGKFEIMYAFKISSDGEIDQSSYKEVAHCKATPNMGDLTSEYTIKAFNDNSNLLITRKREFVLFPKNKDALTYFHTAVDADMNVLWKKDIVMRKGGDGGSFYTFKELDQNGNLIYADLRDKKGADYPLCTLVKYDAKADKLIRLPIDLGGDHKALSARVEVDTETDDSVAHGYYITDANDLGCYFLRLNDDFTVSDKAISESLYTIKKGYVFSEHAWQLKTNGYFPAAGNGGYLIANTKAISPAKKGERHNQIVFKLNKENQFEWNLPVKEGFVKSYFLSTYDITMVKNGKLYLILNDERNLSSLVIDDQANMSHEILIDYKKNGKMIAETDTYFDLSQEKVVVLFRKLLNATANATHSKFGYIDIE